MSAKKLLIKTLVLCFLINSANAQMAVAMVANTDPQYLAMSLKTMEQLADSVSNLQTNYQMVNANNNITEQFAAFANMFGTISGFMNDYVCSTCTPSQLNKWEQLRNSLKNIDTDMCHSIANILKNGGQISGSIGSLAQDINAIMNTNMTSLTPAQTAATQARLLGSLGTGIQQTNTLLHSAMQIQTAQMAKENMAEKNAQLTQQGAFTHITNVVKP